MCYDDDGSGPGPPTEPPPPLAGAPVILRTLRYSSTVWGSTTGYTTDASGSVSVRVTPSSALYVQFVFAGDPSTAAASMSPVLVKTATRTSASAAAGSTTTLTGQLVNAVTGKALPAGQPVTLRVRPCGSSTWSTVTTGLRTDSYGRVVHRAPSPSRPGGLHGLVGPAGCRPLTMAVQGPPPSGRLTTFGNTRSASSTGTRARAPGARRRRGRRAARAPCRSGRSRSGRRTTGGCTPGPPRPTWRR